jgi:hypothetical protein
MNNLTVQQPTETTVMSDLQPQIMSAKRYPRNVEQFLKNAKEFSTINKDVAQSCGYSIPRKDKDGTTKYIMGASVRLAEIAAQCYGNLRVAVNLLPESNDHVTAQALAWDLESNVAIKIETRRPITSTNKKTGKPFRYSTDMINITSNAATSIAYRNAIFRIVPKVYIDTLYQHTVSFLDSGIKTKDDLTRKLKKAVEYFKRAGYSQEHVCTFLGKKSISDLTTIDLHILCGVKNRIDEGEITMDQALPLELGDDVDDTPDIEELLGDPLKDKKQENK